MASNDSNTQKKGRTKIDQMSAEVVDSNPYRYDCVKSVQMQSQSVFSRIRTEYGKSSVFGHFSHSVRDYSKHLCFSPFLRIRLSFMVSLFWLVTPKAPPLESCKNFGIRDLLDRWKKHFQSNTENISFFEVLFQWIMCQKQNFDNCNEI